VREREREREREVCLAQSGINLVTVLKSFAFLLRDVPVTQTFAGSELRPLDVQSNKRRSDV
jgi:hypothetical protein